MNPMLSATSVARETLGTLTFWRVIWNVITLSRTGRFTFTTIVVPDSPRNLLLTLSE